MNKERKPKYPIGTKFIRRNRNAVIETISEIYITRNSKGGFISLRYEATHLLLGQIVTDYDILETSIARGEVL